MRMLRFVVPFGMGVAAAIGVAAHVARAATPSSGSIPQPPNATVGKKGGTTWSDTGKVGVPSPPLMADQVVSKCLGGAPLPQCDVYTLTFAAQADYWTAVVPAGETGHVAVHLAIANDDPDTDVDLYVFDDQQKLVCSSGNAAGAPEDCAIDRPNPGKPYGVVAYYYQDTGLVGYSATADLFLENDAAPGTTNAQAVVFGPATWAELQRVGGGEPMLNVDKRANGRVFVDFPWSTTLATSIVARSTDRGDSFRTLFDPACARSNSTIHCNAAGGGDSELTLSETSDDVFHADQEVLFNFTTSASTNGGDTWPNVNAATATQTAVDRMWLGALGDHGAVLGYHQTSAGGVPNVYYNVTTNDGQSWSADLTGKFSAAQTGNLEVASDGTIVHVYNDNASTNVAVSGDRAQTFATHTVAGDLGGIFPWLAIDTANNLYAIWSSASGSDVMLSTSLAADKGSKWTAPVRVSTPPAQTTVLAAIAAGSPGRVAIVYYGTGGSGAPDTQPADAAWQLYLAESNDALSASPSFTQSVVTRRVPHVGIVCTQGTTCSSGRNLLDMIDVGYDGDGRVYTTYTDDHDDGERTNIRFAKELSGPSLLDGKPAPSDPEPASPMADTAGDAVWPNTASGTDVAGADIVGLGVSDDGTSARFAITVGDATRFEQAIAAVATSGTSRLLFVVRFESADQEWFAAYEYAAGGATRAFTGRILAGDGLEQGQYTGAIGFLAHDAATATISGNTITITQALSALGSPAAGTKLLSVVGASLVGPTEATETRTNILNVVDATRAFDFTVSGGGMVDAGAPDAASANDAGSIDAGGGADASAGADAGARPDSGMPGVDAGAPRDAGSSAKDAATPRVDAAVPEPDAGQPANGANGDTSADSGCGCVAAGGRAGAGGLALAAIGALAFAARRRRRRA